MIVDHTASPKTDQLSLDVWKLEVNPSCRIAFDVDHAYDLNILSEDSQQKKNVQGMNYLFV